MDYSTHYLHKQIARGTGCLYAHHQFQWGMHKTIQQMAMVSNVYQYCNVTLMHSSKIVVHQYPESLLRIVQNTHKLNRTCVYKGFTI